MRMKQKDVIAAFRAMEELAGLRLPYKEAREAARLRRRLREEYETAAERELALAEELGLEVLENGRFRTQDPEKREAFRRAVERQMEEEAEIELPEADLSGFTEELRISPACLEALEGIVKFE